MPRSDLDKAKFDRKKGDYYVGKANDLADPTLQNRARNIAARSVATAGFGRGHLRKDPKDQGLLRLAKIRR